MTTALLLDGLLEDGFTLACVYQVVNLLPGGLPARHNVCAPLYHLPAAMPPSSHKQDKDTCSLPEAETSLY